MGEIGKRAAVITLTVVLAFGAAATEAQAEPPPGPAVPPGTTASYVVFDRLTRSTVARSDEHRRFRSASLVKLLIALDYLYTKGSVAAIPPRDRTLLEAMLRSSDDDAASALWVSGGFEKVVQRMVPRIGLVDTAPPVDRRYWGYTAISAADVVTIYRFPMERAPSSYREIVVGNLERFTRCAADGFDQSFGLPRAVPGPKAVKQGWSGYGAAPAGPACTEGRPVVGTTAASAAAPAEAPRDVAGARPSTLAAPNLDLTRPAMHTSGLVDGRRRIVVVLTLSPDGTTFDGSAATITDLARRLHDRAGLPVPPASPLSQRDRATATR